ncbi:MAG: DNA polymerase I [Clostridia bacterium]|nr:DNA polymerase I [Clostridia bacterium]
MKLLVLDGNSILNRAFYGVKALTTKDGRYTNAIFGFLNIYFRLQELTGATHVAAAFDLKAPTFRHKMAATYKEGRKPMPDELREQLPVIKELLPLLGVTVVTCEGYEADDILGTLSRAAEQAGGDCYLATGDRDSLQLVTPHTTVLLASTKAGQPDTARMDEAAIFDKYGLTPLQLIDLKALMGDASDNIPGVPGVGEKTALSLLHDFGSLDALYEKLETADLRDSLKARLAAGKDSAYLSRSLGTICCEAPIDCELDHYLLRPMQKEALSKMLTDLEFFKLLGKLDLSPAAAKPAVEATMQTATLLPPESLADLLADTSLLLDVVSMADGWYIGRGQRMVQLDTLAPLLDVLGDANVPKRTNDLKALTRAVLPLGCYPDGFRLDTMLAAYLLNPLSSDYSLPRLLLEYGVGFDEATPWAAFATLSDRLTAAVEEQGAAALLRDIELPLAVVLADMELLGVEADGDGLTAYGVELQKTIDDLQRRIYDAVGYEFNLNSPKQLAKALFEDLGLPHGKKTKNGYSTNADVLEKLRTAHPAVDMLLQYRTLAKLKSTYCDGLTKEIAADGRIHSTFNQTETRTGRISSTEPNLQNIPVRQPQGRELRRFLRAKEGWRLVDADYSQIELRVLADMANDPTMIAAFNSGDDIHRITASQVFDLPPELVTPLIRSRAKAVNFGIVYGIGAHSLSEDIGVSYQEAKAYISGYLAHYGAVTTFMNNLIENARQTGYAETLFGRRRPLPELKAGNAMTRSFGERVARNMPIQGTAADIIKLAMIRVWRRLIREGLRARLILQIHDELMVESPIDECDRVATILKEEMESAASLKVVLTADVHVGKTWFDAKE